MQYNDSAIPGEIKIRGGSGVQSTGVPVVADAWKELRAELDLDAGSVELFYDGASIKTTSLASDSTTPIGAILVLGNAATPIFYDDISITASGAGVPGDFDGDSDVDGADFLKWQRDSGDAAELALWETNFGTTAAVAAVASVPEPAAGLHR